MKRFTTVGLLCATALVFAAFGLATGHEGKEGTAVPEAAISMEQAITAATAQFPGKVLEAELESEDGKAVYEIEIVNTSGEIRELEIDGQTGKVLSSEQEDQDEHQKERSGKGSEKS